MVDACGSGNLSNAPASNFYNGVVKFNQATKPISVAKIKMDFQMIKAQKYSQAPTDLNPVICQEQDAGYSLKIGTNYMATLSVSDKVNEQTKNRLIQLVSDLNQKTQRGLAVKKITTQVLKGAQPKEMLYFGKRYPISVDKNLVVSLNSTKQDMSGNLETEKEIQSIIEESNVFVQTKSAENQILHHVQLLRSRVLEGEPAQAHFTYFGEVVAVELKKSGNSVQVDFQDIDSLGDLKKIDTKKAWEIITAANTKINIYAPPNIKY